MFFPRPFGNVYEVSWKSDHFLNSQHKWVNVSFTMTPLHREKRRKKCFLSVRKRVLNFLTLKSMPSPVVQSVAERLKYFGPRPIWWNFPASQNKGDLKRTFKELRSTPYWPSWSAPYLSFLVSAARYCQENFIFISEFSIFVPQFSYPVELLHVWEGIINRLKKIEDFSESLQQYYFKNWLIWCKKKPMELWIFFFFFW